MGASRRPPSAWKVLLNRSWYEGYRCPSRAGGFPRADVFAR
eukprot:CAMPEP_0198552826 /NCGR_PEP_ID=MMETSP1462-20131121/79325_1 /TAXON_ID=1333877 /ORGANISM="Brandtodinium nutriculum, Strain RCC3387" /LENGTH=40 /DNA_ID= /DNA_START= /DNA_END= /DNA_ORIENTATION=